MNFKKISLADIHVFRPYFETVKSNTCDFTVGGMFMWRDMYNMEYAQADDVLYTRLYDGDGNVHYNIPMGGDFHHAVTRLISLEGGSFSFCTVPEEYLPHFLKLGFEVEITEQKDFFDYLYSAHDLSEFKGKRYNAQRNQMHHFLADNYIWSYESITPENVQKVYNFFINKYIPKSSSGEYESEENKKVTEVLENYELYGMAGGFLSANGEIVGFSVCEMVGDTLFVHIEKANRSIRGAYQMLVSQTAQNFARDALFINREEDMGDEGLRRSKQSYHPIKLLKKYIVSCSNL